MFFLEKKKDMYCILDSHFTVQVYYLILSKVIKKTCEGPINKSKRVPNFFFLNFLISKKAYSARYKIKEE